MKKLLIYSLAFLGTLSIATSCKDDDNGVGFENAERLFRPMFRKDDNTGKGDSDPYNCKAVGNTIYLNWYTVKDAVGYEIKWSTPINVAGGKEAWEKTEAESKLSGKVIVEGGDKYSYEIEHLNYSTDYRFAIRALHSLDPNDPKNSEWYGYGDGRQWAEYLGIMTDNRYNTPTIIQVSNITKESLRVNLNRSREGYKAEELKEFDEHFKSSGDYFKVDRLTVLPSASTPDATVDAKFKDYKLTDADWELGYVDVTGLSQNAVYDINVWDNDIPVAVDACYNSLMKRTKGDPGAPIIIEPRPQATDTMGEGSAAVVFDIAKYNATKLDHILNNYMKDMLIAENQVFYLRGGETYYVSTNVSIYKGFTLATLPEDVAAGKKATFLVGGMYINANAPVTCNFMLGRQPEAGENPTIQIDIDSIRFKDLLIDCPLAANVGHADQKIYAGSAGSGNYFLNMYSNGMGFNANLLEWDGCEFQGMIRGFFRTQGSNQFNLNELNIKNCDFYNCGFYDQKGAGYQWIFADMNGKPKASILQHVEICNNTFYDSPHGCLITDNNRNIVWDPSVCWNINVHHNTFINWNNAAVALMNYRYFPGGSSLTFEDNLIILTKDPSDTERPLYVNGCDIRNIQGGDGSASGTFYFRNNWSTNDNLTNGQIFTGYAFTATSNAVAKWLSKNPDWYPYGKDELTIKVCDISATELMVSPNPKNKIKGVGAGQAQPLDHHTDNLDGLYYQKTEKVANCELVQLGIGASKWYK